MTENVGETRAPLSLEEVAQAVLELAQERSLEGFVTRFQEKVRAWAAPSGVLAAARDPAADSGWRLLSALSTGSGPLGAERLIRQFLDELPEGLARPSLVRPAQATAGVRMRGNCLVPWSCEGESGVLVLRGVGDPAPPNLADAIALLSVPVWPRLLGGPAARVEASVAELRRLADRLRDDADRQVERLQAARLPVVAEPQAADPVAARRLAELEEKLAAASAEVERLSALGDALRSEGLAVSARLVEERRATAEAGASAQAGRESLTAAREGLAEAEERVAALALEREELRQQVAALEKALVEAGEERRAAAEAGAVAQAARESLTAAREGLAEAEERAAALALEREELRQQVAALEKALVEAEEERRAAAEAGAVAQAGRESLTAAREGLAEAEERAAALALEREELRQQVAALEKALVEAEEERRAAAEAGAVAQAARESLTAAREGLAEAEERAAALALEREELRQQVAALEKALVEAEEERDVARAARAAEPAPGPGQSEDVLCRTLVVLRRTPYLPPPLRVAAQEAEAAVGAKDQRPWARITLLDRDSAGLESLAAELEAEGLDVKIASHPEELALLLKTPAGRELDAAICDVLAFRPDQTVAGVFRGWEKDRPGLALYLSFSRDSPAEVERAQRIPLSLTKGRFQRPLNRLELMEILGPLRRRSS